MRSVASKRRERGHISRSVTTHGWAPCRMIAGHAPDRRDVCAGLCLAANGIESDGTMPSKVFVGNLHFNTTRDEVQSLFSQAGEVRDVFLPTDRESGRPRGFAFVEFATDEDAAKAIEKFNGHDLGGRALRVNAAEDRPRTGGAGAGG